MSVQQSQFAMEGQYAAFLEIQARIVGREPHLWLWFLR